MFMPSKPAAGIAASALIMLMFAMVRSTRASHFGRRKTLGKPAAKQGTGSAGGVDARTTAITSEISQPLSAILANVDAGTLLWKQRPLPADELKNILADISDDVLRIREAIRKPASGQDVPVHREAPRPAGLPQRATRAARLPDGQ
jgi:hypothetical protein